MALDYVEVADAEYIEDDYAGARIDGAAIRKTMQRILDTGDSAFHVHRHDQQGSPWFSPLDLRELKQLVPSFTAVGPGTPHGAVVLSYDSASMISWTDGAIRPSAGLVSVIGYPTLVRRGTNGL